jgi:hypothetical protein
MKTHPLVRALIAMMPEACFHLVKTTDWCSMTFSGQQLVIECVAGQSEPMSEFCAGLPDHEFSIPHMLVADIAVITSAANADEANISCVIEALVLDA